jgi:hypothetical protein
MIESARLLDLLAPHGFQIAWEKWAGRQFNYDFVRPSSVDGVYEHVDVDSMGKRGEVAYCRVWVSPVRGHRLHFKPSPEVDEYLAELIDPATGRSRVIESRSDAIAWEQQVAHVAPERVRSLAQRHAEQMALQTASERQAASEYARRIRQISEEPVMEYLAYQLGCRATPSQQQLARGFDAGFVSGDVQYACECAAIGVALFGAEVDAAHHGFTDELARKSLELKVRLNITADILRLGEP